MNRFGISTFLRQKLLADATLKELVGERIYPCQAIEGVTDNYIVMSRESYSIEWNKMNITKQEVGMYIACLSSDYDTSVAMAQACFNALNGRYPTTENQINTVYLTDSLEDKVGDLYIQALYFEIN